MLTPVEVDAVDEGSKTKLSLLIRTCIFISLLVEIGITDQLELWTSMITQTSQKRKTN